MSAPLRSIQVDDLAAILETVRQAKARAKEWATLADQLMAQVKDRVGDADEATVEGRPVVRHSTRTVTRLDAKTLRAELGEPVVAPYLRTTVEHRYELVEAD